MFELLGTMLNILSKALQVSEGEKNTRRGVGGL